MFQQTIQDVLAVAEAGTRADAVLESVRTRISAFEPFEGAELLATTEGGLRRFTVNPGLGEVGPGALAALGEEATLRLNTSADIRTRGLSSEPGLTSLLILGVGAPGASVSALVLGHSRAWSFAGAPLSRIRTIAQVALRLLLSRADNGSSPSEITTLQEEVARLRTHAASLETEIAHLRAGRQKR